MRRANRLHGQHSSLSMGSGGWLGPGDCEGSNGGSNKAMRALYHAVAHNTAVDQPPPCPGMHVQAPCRASPHQPRVCQSWTRSGATTTSHPRRLTSRRWTPLPEQVRQEGLRMRLCMTFISASMPALGSPAALHTGPRLSIMLFFCCETDYTLAGLQHLSQVISSERGSESRRAKRRAV